MSIIPNLHGKPAGLHCYMLCDDHLVREFLLEDLVKESRSAAEGVAEQKEGSRVMSKHCNWASVSVPPYPQVE